MNGMGFHDYLIVIMTDYTSVINDSFNHGMRNPRLKEVDLGCGGTTPRFCPTNLCCFVRQSSSSTCFRTRNIAMAGRRGSRGLGGNTTDSSSQDDDDEGSPSDSNSKSLDEDSASSSDDSAESTVKTDKHGPPSDTATLKAFYGAKKRVDAKEVTCVLNNKTLGFYFKTM